jgi:hypothetical protein
VTLPLPPDGFPKGQWSPAWTASLLLGEFCRSVNLDALICPKPEPPTEPEFAQLVRAAEDERADALGEILTQGQEFITPFLALLGITAGSHKKTARLLYAAEMIGALAAMHFKDKFNRPRPSQYRPALLPPVPVPGHAAYPSGHATQAHLMALFIARATADTAAGKALEQASDALARRIARNREIAGLHFASDSQAGEKLAASIHDELRTATAPLFTQAFTEAAAEWAQHYGAGHATAKA